MKCDLNPRSSEIKKKKLCNDEVMRVTAQWIILGWLILFVNKKDCSQTSCKLFIVRLPSCTLLLYVKLTWKSSLRSTDLINPVFFVDSILVENILFRLLLFLQRTKRTKESFSEKSLERVSELKF